jgi:hypothetical protein
LSEAFRLYDKEVVVVRLTINLFNFRVMVTLMYPTFEKFSVPWTTTFQVNIILYACCNYKIDKLNQIFRG